MKRIIIVSALALAACGKPAEQASPAGQETAARRQTAAGKAVPAPPLALEKIIRGELKAVKNWEDLKGKAVVLEFWGIYCQPCVENIPHLNELAEKFRDKQVVFISLTRDKQGNVEKFLKEHEMKGNVAVEAGAAFRSFRVNGIPHTVLVDKDGLIKAVTYPSRVTESVIEALLAGGPVPGDNAAEAAADSNIWIAFGAMEKRGGNLYDTAFLYNDEGRLVHRYARISRGWLTRRNKQKAYKMGKAVKAVNTPFGRFAFEICGDIFDAGIRSRLRALSPDYLFCLMWRSFDSGKYDQVYWDKVEKPEYLRQLRGIGSAAFFVNTLSREKDEHTFGGPMAVLKSGKVLKEAKLGKPALLVCEVPYLNR